MTLPPPNELGAPQRYSAWRPGQAAAVDRLLVDPKRFQILALSVGSGKSLQYATYLTIRNERAVILVHTIGQQQQIERDFAEVGFVNVMGMGQYTCKLVGGTCDEAPCTDGESCWLKSEGCTYYDADRRGRGAMVTIMSYAKWFTQHRQHQDYQGVQILVADESHLVLDVMSDFLRVEISDRDNAELGLGGWPGHSTIAEWAAWAGTSRDVVKYRMQQARSWQKKHLRKLRDKLDGLARAASDPHPWVWERGPRGMSWEPLWPGLYLEDWLWGGVPTVVLSSATIRPKQLAQMGLIKDDYSFMEYPSPIPVSRRPVIYSAASPPIRLKGEAGGDAAMLGRWVQRMDRLIEQRLDRKGIIHAVSFKRAEYIKAHSRYGSIMLVHDSKTTRACVQAFKESDPPVILLSPSVTTGWDFPGDLAQYQIIAKVPFIPAQSLLVRARTEQDPDYPMAQALQTLVQMAGRVCRGPEDVGETLIVDGQCSWLVGKYREYTPAWFRAAFRKVEGLPEPPTLDLGA